MAAMRMLRLSDLGRAALVLLALAVGSARAQEPVTVGQTFLAASLDPAKGNAGWALTSHGVGQTLFTVTRDGRLEPQLAEKAEALDARTWTVHLRPGLRFADGTPLDAEATARALARTVRDNPAARSSATLSFQAIDPLTLRVEGDRSLPILPSVLAEWPFVVYRETARGLVFTGPWQVAGFEPDREMRLVPNAQFPGAGGRSAIRLRRFGDPQALALAVQSGEVDLGFNAPVESLPQLKATRDITVKSFPVGYQYMAWMNTTRPALADVRVRRAIDLSIDRRQLVVALGGGEPATGAYARQFPFASQGEQPFDRNAAGALLDEAGWRLESGKRQKDGQTLKLVLVAYPQRPDLVSLQPVLRDALMRLGLEVETRVAENPQATAREGNYDLLLWAQHTAPAERSRLLPQPLSALGRSQQPCPLCLTTAGRSAEQVYNGVRSRRAGKDRGRCRADRVFSGARRLSAHAGLACCPVAPPCVLRIVGLGLLCAARRSRGRALTPAARLAELLGFLLAASFAAFAVVRAMPGDPAETMLVAQGLAPTPEQVAAFKSAYGLNGPLWRQFVLWLAHVPSGDLGTSMRSGEPVMRGLLARLPVSLTIGLGGLLSGSALAFALGFAAAAGSRGAERVSRALALVAQAVPAFCLAVVVIWIFGVELRWIRPFTGGALERIMLPLLIVALYTAGGLVRVVAHAIEAAAATPWFRAVRAKGLPQNRALLVHAGPFGLLALLAALRAEAAWVIGGTAVVEVVFGAPGVSAWVVESIGLRDYPVLQAYILTVAVWMVLVRFAVDQLSVRLDSRREAR